MEPRDLIRLIEDLERRGYAVTMADVQEMVFCADESEAHDNFIGQFLPDETYLSHPTLTAAERNL